MVGVGAVVVFLGYWLFTYGYSQTVGKCNAGFLSLANPFGAQPQCNPDTGGGGYTGQAVSSGKNVGATATSTTQAVNQYSSKSAAEAQGKQSGGQFAVVHNPNGSWSVLEA